MLSFSMVHTVDFDETIQLVQEGVAFGSKAVHIFLDSLQSFGTNKSWVLELSKHCSTLGGKVEAVQGSN